MANLTMINDKPRDNKKASGLFSIQLLHYLARAYCVDTTSVSALISGSVEVEVSMLANSKIDS